MKKTLCLVACLGIIGAFWACERPKSPDFKLDHKVQAPLTVNQTYQFLGGAGALVDTTSEDYESLFNINENSGLVSLSKEQDLEFNELKGAIPEVNVTPTITNAQVGEIELTNFASSGNVGSVTAKEITGSSPNEGQNLPAGSANNISIDNFNPDYFESATVKNDGAILITLENNLGFNASDVTVRLNSDGSTVGSDNISPLDHNTTETATIPVSAGDQLSNLGVELDVSWNNQTMQDDAGSLVVTDVVGEDDSDPSRGLVASQVTAAVTSQQFNTSGNSEIDNSNFQFTKPDHFIGLSGGNLTIDIANDIDLAIEDLNINFPDIRNKSDDSQLEINISEIPAQSDGGSYSNSYSLADYRIYGEGGIDYNIDATTENTQQGSGSDTRQINENDHLQAAIGIDNLDINRAEGVISPKNVLVNNDADSDGTIDIQNDDEAKTISIDGISTLSNRISDISFANPILNMIYSTNLGVNTTIYAAISGTSANGNTIYLKGDTGDEYNVAQDEVPPELVSNGSQLDAEQVIKFPLQTPTDGTDAIELDTSRTNASVFFSNLPSDIRFVGVARINDDNEEGYLDTPVNFDPSMSVNLPFNISAEGATFQDTLDADLSGLPGKGDKRQLSQATITLNYTNALPIKLDLSLVMLDDNNNEVTSYPLASSDNPPVVIQAAQVNSDGFVEGGGVSDKVQISFTEDQLGILNQIRSMILDIGLNTAQQQEVKIRSDDSVTFRMKMSVDVTSTVN